MTQNLWAKNHLSKAKGTKKRASLSYNHARIEENWQSLEPIFNLFPMVIDFETLMPTEITRRCRFILRQKEFKLTSEVWTIQTWVGDYTTLHFLYGVFLDYLPPKWLSGVWGSFLTCFGQEIGFQLFFILQLKFCSWIQDKFYGIWICCYKVMSNLAFLTST